jgi:hypothetical protein
MMEPYGTAFESKSRGWVKKHTAMKEPTSMDGQLGKGMEGF